MSGYIYSIILDEIQELLQDERQAIEERNEARIIACRLLRERDEAVSSKDVWHAASIAIGNQRDALQSQVNHLESDRDELVEAQYGAMHRLSDSFSEKCDERDALAKQVDELVADRNILVSQLNEVMARNAQLRESLEQVEWECDMIRGWYCPMCVKSSGYFNLRVDRVHSKDCKRQVALGLAKE